jgi:peroxiredoxin/TolA-binding protein
MKLAWSIIAVLVVAGATAAQQPAEKAPAEKAPADAVRTEENRPQRLESLKRDYGRRLEAVQESIEELEAKLNEQLIKQQVLADEYLVKLMEIVAADPQDETALAAIEEALATQLDYVTEEQAEAMFAVLTAHHAPNERASTICQLAAELELNDASRAFLNAVVAKNKHPEAKAWALFALATDKYNQADEANDPKLFKEAEQMFDRLVKTIPADETEGTPVDAAERYLFELRNLMVGQAAPDFETRDLASKRVKLSDHRGKSVLLMFWSTWCPYCDDLLAQQQKLAETYAGRPLTLLSISGDDEARTVAQHIAERKLLAPGQSWIHCWNGPEGGVLDAWNVQAFPTIYVIDAQGKIRHRNLFDGELASAVESLVKEAEQADRPREP